MVELVVVRIEEEMMEECHFVEEEEMRDRVLEEVGLPSEQVEQEEEPVVKEILVQAEKENKVVGTPGCWRVEE